MDQNGSTWNSFAGGDALLLAATLFIISGILAYLGTRSRHALSVERPGRAISIGLVGIWVLAFSSWVVAISIYITTLFQQVGEFTSPANPITPITVLSGFVTFIIIAFLARGHGLKTALGSAIVGTIVAPMIFELPFDLIVMWRTYPPAPTALFTLLFFLPLFLVEIISFMLLTLSPLMKITRFTLFSLAAMFLVFAIWALFGFSYPSSPIPIALNAIAKVLSFVAAITLFSAQRTDLIAGRTGAATDKESVNNVEFASRNAI
jgi:hypothetical protein